jgi:hypothetical protein
LAGGDAGQRRLGVAEVAMGSCPFFH